MSEVDALPDSERKRMMNAALNEYQNWANSDVSDMTLLEIRNSDDSLAGIATYVLHDEPIDDEDDESPNYRFIELENMGAMGGGSGEQLFRAVVEKARQESEPTSILLEPLDENAASFWTYMGLREDPDEVGSFMLGLSHEDFDAWLADPEHAKV